jgi:hypothetical protein
MSKIEVDAITEQSGTTLTTGGGAGKTVVVDATTVTLGRCGGTVALASGATQTGFGRTGTVDWDTTPKTATFTAVSGDGFFANTTGSAFNMNLPAGSAGAIVSVADYAGTWQTNALTVVPNGTDKIGGINANVVLSTEGQSVTFIFVDSTQGWINTMDSTSNERGAAFITATGGTITCSGNFKIHTFTGPGTFCVSQISNTPANNEISYVVVAGGGGGGNSAPAGTASGGGGAGGYREKKSSIDSYTASPTAGGCAMTITASPFPVTVGGGAAANSSAFAQGNNGNSSVFNGITSTGGGGGAAYATPPGQAGGSGGGGGDFPHPNNPTQSGNGNTPPVSPSQGNGGGNGAGQPQSNNVAGGGGGGISGGGSNASSGNGGAGGNGLASSITGSPVTRAGGGGGGGNSTGSGGSGGGGAGSNLSPGQTATAGTANTGGGGGGTAAPSSGCNPGSIGGTGGSGIVIIRYKFQ